jgi:hypothetical protein
VRNVRGGLTAVSMPALTRSALWSALKSRRCYGTTGARILLRLTAGDAQMGDEITLARAPVFEVGVEGTAPIETIEFFRDDVLLATADPMANAGALSNRIRVAWNGASAPGNWQRARMQWDGELRVRGAQIVGAEPWAFDTPDEGLREVAETRVGWRSITAGDWDGLVLELDDARGDLSGAELTFVSEPMSLTARLGELGATARVFEAANPARKVELRRLPRAMPALGWRGRFEDRLANPPSDPLSVPLSAPPSDSLSAPLSDPPSQASRASAPVTHAYWIRVRQADGEYAWSTPIFVTIDPSIEPDASNRR